MRDDKILDERKARDELERITGNNYACCYQCGKCSAGCPAGEKMEEPASVIMRLVQAGRIVDAMKSQSLWMCTGCQTCTTRCPQNMDIAGTLDALREMAIKHKLVSPDRARKLANAFHVSVLNTVKKTGRLAEMAMTTSYKIRTQTFTQDMDAGILMMLQGKINPLSLVLGGDQVEKIDQIKKIFELADRDHGKATAEKRKPGKTDNAVREQTEIDPSARIGYYPGCSLSGMAKDYGISSRLMCDKLGLDVREIEDWNCCGASSAHATNHKLAMLLPARNQALADAQGFDYVLTPCAACLNHQVLARNELLKSAEFRKEVEEITGTAVTCKAKFINPIELILGLGIEFLKSKVVRPLSTMSLACYYGCLLVRPAGGMGFDDVENPMKMDEVVRALGAEAVDWAFKVECCGAGLTMPQPKMIEEMTHRIAVNAADSGAKAFVVACPICHSNLDMRQKKMRKRFGDVKPMPVYYFSELIAIACGADPREAAVGKHFVPAIDMVKK